MLEKRDNNRKSSQLKREFKQEQHSNINLLGQNSNLAEDYYFKLSQFAGNKTVQRMVEDGSVFQQQQTGSTLDMQGLTQRKVKEVNNRLPQKKVDPRNYAKKSTNIKEETKSAVTNKAGLPEQLKSGIEQLSNMDLSEIQVHYNSKKPKDINAHAFTQGNEIHVGPGQERYLAHEAWHVVQQKQGRVKPTTRVGGVNVNDNKALEREADLMGARALKSGGKLEGKSNPVAGSGKGAVQRKSNVVQGFFGLFGGDKEKDKKKNAQSSAKSESSEKKVELSPLEKAIESRDIDAIMEMKNFGIANNGQKVQLVAIMLKQMSVNAKEEAKIIDILASAGAGLGSLMNAIIAAGLKQDLFDAIDDQANKDRFTEMLSKLDNEELNKDLEVFNRGFWGNLVEGVKGAAQNVAETFSFENLLMGMLHPIIHPIDSVMSIVEKGESMLKKPSFDTLLDIAKEIFGLIAMWSLIIGGLFTGITALATAGIVTIPAAIPIGAIAAFFMSVAAFTGGAFLIVTGISLAKNLVEAGTATTHEELEEEKEEIAQDGLTLVIAGIMMGVIKGVKSILKRVRGPATDKSKANMKELNKAGESAKDVQTKSEANMESMKQLKNQPESGGKGKGPKVEEIKTEEVKVETKPEVEQVKVGDNLKASDLKMTKTVENHAFDIIKKGVNKGELSRPYVKSNGTNMLIDEIMMAKKPVPDSFLENGLRWDVSGTFRGNYGTWELVVDVNTKMIVHFNFITK